MSTRLAVVILGWAAYQNSCTSRDPIFLSSTIPAELSAQINVQNLPFNDNILRDTIPTMLNFHNNSLFGDVPISRSYDKVTNTVTATHSFNCLTSSIIHCSPSSHPTIQSSIQPNLEPLPHSATSQLFSPNSIVQLLVLVLFLFFLTRRVVRLFIDHTIAKCNSGATTRMPRCLPDTMTTKRLLFVMLSVLVMIVSGQSPTSQPSDRTSIQPSNQPSVSVMRPSGQPTVQPSQQPSTNQPSGQPSQQPSSQPSAQPVMHPSSQPSRQPSQQPTVQPSCEPTNPSGQPSRQPSSQPSAQPIMRPSGQPSRRPSSQPTAQPIMRPSGQPSRQPSSQPSAQPFRQPSAQPTRCVCLTSPYHYFK